MDQKIYSMISFAVGAAIGSAVTYKLIKTKYEQIVQEDSESLKEYWKSYYEKRVNKEDEAVEEDAEEESSDVNRNYKSAYEKPDLIKYAAKLVDNNEYTDYSNNDYDHEEGEEYEEKEDEDEVLDTEDYKKPYIIEPDDFGDTGYETVSLTYYADGMLADDFDNLIEDPDYIVGEDFSDHFGEFENDTVFVRNDEFETDYEICRDERNYYDVIEQED